jgi:cobalt/nickel transport system permease protein
MGFEAWTAVGRMDELSGMDTPLHRLDARAKAVVTLAFIGVVMSFGRYEVSALTPFVAYPLGLVAVGRLPFGYLARKAVLAAPFALAAGMFNPLLDRHPAAAIGPFAVAGGWLSFASLVLRFALTVGAALALVACTGMHRLCTGLEQMGMPRALATQLLLLYRYLFVVTADGGRMMRSVELRRPGAKPCLRVYGPLVGHLLLRSMDRAHRVYRAMVARGFDGEVRAGPRPAWGWPATTFVAGWALYFAVGRAWNLADAVGRRLAEIAR